MRVAIICMMLSITSFAQEIFVRYNQAGYKPSNLGAFIVQSDTSLNGVKWVIDSAGSELKNGYLKSSLTGKGVHTNLNYNYKVELPKGVQSGDHSFIINGRSYKFKVSSHPYTPYLKDILRYLKQQRSGTTETIDKVPGHFSDSSSLVYLHNKTTNTWEVHPEEMRVNVIGGWYDAGDYLKFTLTNTYTTYNLLRALEYGGKHFDADLKSQLKNEIQFGLDYLQKCVVNDSLLVIQVGDERDHNLGDRLPNEDTNPHRYAYVGSSKPHYALLSATYAIAARSFYANDSIQKKKYIQQSEEFLDRAIKEKKSVWYQKGHEVFYADKSGYDNIILAAAELYKTTNLKKHLASIQYYSTMAGMGYWASWSDLNLHAHNIAGLYYKRSAAFAKNELEYFEGIAQSQNNIWDVPHEYTWGSLYSFFNVGINAKVHAINYEDSAFIYLANAVLDYTFGRNNWGVSFVASEQLPNSVKNIYAQTYKLQPQLFPTGAIAEGPGDIEGHLENKRWFSISPTEYQNKAPFNTQKVVFFDDNSDFQTMETTIGGLSDGFLFLTLMNYCD